MATFLTDFGLIDAFADTTGWTFNSWEPTLNDSASNSPNYIEGIACAFWPLSKGVTGGYASHSGNSQAMNSNKLLVGWLCQLNADITNIPITTMQLRIASSTDLASNAAQWDAKAQLLSPLNAPISGLVPILAHEDTATTVAGTPVFSTISNVGFWGTTGGVADGKQGWFDMLFVISYIGLASHDYTAGGYFDALYDYSYDNNTGNGVPSENNRPLGIYFQSTNSFKSNVSLYFGSSSGDTALTVVESNKAIEFGNVHADHNLGYVFNDPVTGDLDVRMTDITHAWSIEQGTTGEIFTDPADAVDWQWDGCTFSGGGAISFPPDSVNRWFRGGKFTNCQNGSASDGECTTTTFSGCKGSMVVSGDADFTDCQFLTPQIAADDSALDWNGNFDPDGNLDGCTFSKGANAHHALAFGTASPLTMTLRNIDFTGFNASDAQNDSTFHVLRTSGTVTINLFNVTGNTSYKSAGATVNIVADPVTTAINVTDNVGVNLQNARVLVRADSGGPRPHDFTVTITRVTTVATVAHTAHGYIVGDKVQLKGITDKTEDNGVQTIATVPNANSYTYTTTNSGSTSYTGTILETAVFIDGLTNSGGDISDSRVFASDQPVDGFVRKSSGSPNFVAFNLTGNTIDSVDGLTLNIRMQLDE